MISLYSVPLLFPDLSETRMKSEAKENVPSEKEMKAEDRLAAPEIDEDPMEKFSQNETESLPGAGSIPISEESVLGKRSFSGEINLGENAGGGTPDRPGRPSVPTPSKG